MDSGNAVGVTVTVAHVRKEGLDHPFTLLTGGVWVQYKLSSDKPGEYRSGVVGLSTKAALKALQAHEADSASFSGSNVPYVLLTQNGDGFFIDEQLVVPVTALLEAQAEPKAGMTLQ